ncbi:BAG family molecular chaperone regulator 1 [Crotalus adamanteus]|uniref:BAG family molecular chaperone regulator 1 n=1 Tax=Crotalus adamanteus TaxID=8729 RepID=A0AAW1B588_CROAD
MAGPYEKSAVIVTVTYGNEKHNLQVDSQEDSQPTVHDLALLTEQVTGVPVSFQKLIYKGKSLKEMEQPLSTLGVKNGCKVMLIGKRRRNLSSSIRRVRIPLKVFRYLRGKRGEKGGGGKGEKERDLVLQKRREKGERKTLARLEQARSISQAALAGAEWGGRRDRPSFRSEPAEVGSGLGEGRGPRADAEVVWGYVLVVSGGEGRAANPGGPSSGAGGFLTSGGFRDPCAPSSLACLEQGGSSHPRVALSSPVPLVDCWPDPRPAHPPAHLAGLSESSEKLCRNSAAVPGLLSARVNFRVSEEEEEEEAAD